MGRAGGVAFRIYIDGHDPGTCTQHHLTRRSRRTARDRHALPGQGQHQR